MGGLGFARNVNGAGNKPSVVVDTTDSIVFSNTTLTGHLTLLQGSVFPGGSGIGDTVTVLGDAVFLGGTLAASLGSFDVAGDVALAGTTATSLPGMRCAGNWSSDANIQATSGQGLTFDGTGVQTIIANGSTLTGLTVAAGSTLLGSATTTIDGNLTIAGTIVGGTFHVDGSLLASGPMTNGLIRLVGAGTRTYSGLSPINDLIVDFAGNLTMSTVIVGGDFTLLQGNVQSGGNITDFATIVGAADLQGGALVDSNGTFSFLGALNFAGTDVSDLPGLSVSSAFLANANFQPAGGSTITFAGTSPQTVDAPGATFDQVTVAAGSIIQPVGVLNIANSFTVTGNVDGGTIRAAGNVTVNGSLEGGQQLVLEGGGNQTVSGSGTIDAITVESLGTVTFSGTLTVGGDLSLVSGAMKPGALVADLVTVLGTTVFQGGSFIDGNGSFDFDGDVVITGSDLSDAPTFTSGGNWTQSGGVAPNFEAVTFDGNEPQTITGSAVDFFDLEIAAGAEVNLTSPAFVANDLTVDGVLVATASIEVEGDFNVSVPAVVTLGFETHRFGGAFTANGKLHGFGTVVFDGAGIVTCNAASQLPDVRIDSNGMVEFNAQTISGSFELVAGTLGIRSLQLLRVDGDALFSGGLLRKSGPSGGLGAALDVDGNIEFSGTSVFLNVPRIECGGDWSADDAFEPAENTVALDGLGDTTVSSTAGDDSVQFNVLELRNGRRTAATDLVLGAADLTVFAGAALDLSDRRLAVASTQLTIDGELAVAAGGELALGNPVVLTVGSTGMLTVIGDPTNPARVTGVSGGGYDLTVAGALAASNFVFEDMGPAGIVIESSAAIASAPNDLRGGRFDRAEFAPGSVLLDLRRTSPADFRYLEFENTTGSGNFNVRTQAGGAAISFTNHSGAFAGPAFEDDPSGLIDWAVPEATQLANFVATGGTEMVALDWMTTDEVDVDLFVLERSINAGGPFAVIALLPALGASSYQHVDLALLGRQTYFYRLSERLTHGAGQLLASASATAASADDPENVFTVGPGAQFPDIQSALNATVATHGVIRVLPGVYPSFSVDGIAAGSIRILGESGQSVAIDTSFGPVEIKAISSGATVELAHLAVGTAGSTGPALVVTDAEGVVILDEVVIQGGGAAPGVALDAAAAVSIQSCEVAGSPGLLARESKVVAGRGAIDEVDAINGSFVQLVELGPVVTADASSTVVPVPGIMPKLIAPEFVGPGATLPFEIEGSAGSPWFLVVAAGTDIVDAPQLDLIGFVNPATTILAAQGSLDPTGGAAGSLYFPEDASAFSGMPVVFQLLVWSPAAGAFRWSNIQSVIII